MKEVRRRPVDTAVSSGGVEVNNNEHNNRGKKIGPRFQRLGPLVAIIIFVGFPSLFLISAITNHEKSIEKSIEISLHHLAIPLSSILSTCEDSLRSESQKDLAVALIAADRPHYLIQVLKSLQHQTIDNFHVFIFVDFCGSDDCNKVLKLVQDAVDKNPDRCSFKRASESIGIGRMTFWAIDFVFNNNHDDDISHIGTFDRILLLEDDHLIGYSYIEAMQMLLSASEHMPNVALVNGNFIDTPQNGASGHLQGRKSFEMKQRDEDCHFQVVEPFHANIDLNAHNAWAWATTRNKYETIQKTLHDAFQAAHLHDTPYKNRNQKLIVDVMNQYCPKSGYTRWQGQDWLRACIFYHYNMRQKLQPTSRLMSYIGAGGLHMTNEAFHASGFDPVSSQHVTKDVSLYPEQLCRDICSYDITEIFSAKLKGRITDVT